MINRPRAHLLVPLLALGLSVGMVATAQAQDRYSERSSSSSLSLQINFGSTPRWTNIRGTNVRRIRDGDRTDYDMFRVGRRYYAYNNANNRWYTSRGWRGSFTMIADRSVPRELRRIPRQHWRNYPSAWEDRDTRGGYGSSGFLQVSFGTRPRWSGISGTSVYMIQGANRPSYDVFRYGGSYYAYSGDRWYSSDRESGRFDMIDDRDVPSEFSRVSRTNWRHYPSTWENRGYGSSNNGSSLGLTVSFGTTPRWSNISGTNVQGYFGAGRPDYDVFRYGNSYYAYNGDRWYSSSRESGQFAMIDDSAVPSEFSRVPRHNWRHYPAGWQNDDNDQRDDNWRRNSRDRNDQYGGGGGEGN